MPQNTKMLIGAIVAAALAIAVYYGAIDQKQASSIQTKTNETLGTAPASQPAQPQPAPPPAPQNPPAAPAPVPAPAGQAPQAPR